MTLEKLKVMIEAETKQYKDALKQVRNETKSATSEVTNQTSKIKSAFSSIGKFIAGLALVRGLYNFGKSTLKMASDLQEVQNVVDTAFGSMREKCEEFAKTSITQFGMSELSAKRTASTYMAMAKGIGMGADSASDMAIQLAGLTGDVASFFNISQSEASTKLKSVFTGETESLKDLGVVMTQTNLKQYALSQGMSDNIESMDQVTLTALRCKFVVDQLSLANGDFAKTSGSWANQVRILQEQWKQFMTIMGNGLVAVLTPVIQMLNRFMAKLVQMAQTANSVISGIFGKNKGSTAAAVIAGDTADAINAQDGLGTALDTTAKKAKKTAQDMKSIGGFDELNIIQPKNGESDNDGGGSTGITPIATDYGFDEEGDTTGVEKTINKVKGYLDKFTGFLKRNKIVITSLLAGLFAGFTAFEIIKHFGLISGAMTAIVAPIKTLITGFQVLFMGLSEGSGLLTTLSAIFGAITAPALIVATVVGAITAALVYLWQTSEQFRAIVIDAVSALMGVLSNFYESIIKPLFAFLSDVFLTILVPIANFLTDVFVTAVDVVMSIVLTFWTNVLAPIANFLVDILAIALQGVIDVWLAWKPAIEGVYACIQWIWDNILKPIVEFVKNKFIKAFENFGEVIKKLIPSVKEIFQGFVDFLVGIFTLNIDKVVKGIIKIFQGINSFLGGIFTIDWTKYFGGFGNVLNGFSRIVNLIWESIKRIFQGFINFLVGIFTLDINKAVSGIIEIFQGIDTYLGGIFMTDWTKYFGGFGNILNGFLTSVSDIWDSIKLTFSGVIDFITGTFSGNWSQAWNGISNIFSGIFDGLGALLKTPFNVIIGMINWVIDKINGVAIDVPDWVPGIGGSHFGLDIEKLNYLAKGGIVDGPTLSVVGEAGKEAVLPLENNTGWISLLASQLNMFGGDNAKLDKMIELLSMLIKSVDDKDLSIGDRDIGEANNRYNSRKGFSFGNV